MCGLTGYCSGGNSVSNNVIEAMTSKIFQRGSDGSGRYQDEVITLSHQLLAICDNPHHHSQPMQSNTSPWVLMLDGEIYNLDELKTVISSAFKNEPHDTRLLYEAIRKYDWDFHLHISGMFIIALYNKEEKRIRFYTDPSGQKNFYYYFDGSAFVFSSEIKGLLAHPNVEPDVDYQSIEILCAHGYLPGKKTIIKNINKIQAGEIITYDIYKNKLEITTMQISDAGSLPIGNFEKTSLELIRLHTQTKFPIALNLSGGIDSSFLFFLLKENGVSFHTFSTKFLVDPNLTSYNHDAKIATQLSDEHNITHHELVITPKEVREVFIESLETIEEPNCGVSIPAYHLLAKKQKELGFKVVISGEGGDELFGGYPHYQAIAKGNSSETTLRENPALYLNYYQRYMQTSYLNSLIEPEKIYDYIITSCSNYLHEYLKNNNPLMQSMHVDRFIWLAGQTFVRAEKTNLRHNLELRCPLSYQPYRQYVDALLDNSEYISQEQNKIYLRHWLNGRVPNYITKNKTKLGWTAPIIEWYDVEMKELYIHILDDASKNYSDYINWRRALDVVKSVDKWPGREIYTLITLAVILKSLKMKI